MVAALTASGDLTDPAWGQAIEQVPRHLFAPDVAWAATPGGGYRIDRDADPDAWMAAAYGNHPIITQVADGGADASLGEGPFTSSLSAPDVVAEFLHLLDVYVGDRVLEIGTGTGWTAGLLSARLGEQNVTSIEVDPAVAEQAASNLKTAGFAPRLVVGDGAAGDPDGVPFDRVHVTCGVAEIPYTWVEQTRLGGLIAVPWMPAYEGGHKLTLTPVGDGTAVGRFRGGCSYMMLRSQRPSRLDTDGAGGWRESTSVLDPRRVWRAGYGFDVAAAGMLPGVASDINDDREDGTFTFWLWASDSRASVSFAPGHEIGVRQDGPRDLWNELVEVYRWWLRAGMPGRERFGLTVSPEGQRVWLDSPERVLSAGR